MKLAIPAIGVDSGLTWEQSVNTNAATVDQHNHSPGQGVAIGPAGMSINASLPFNNNAVTGLQAAQFTPQASSALTNALYTIGSDLYYNDGANNVVRVTMGGGVNATSSGISSGTASAAFVSSVLVVNADTNKPANIKAGSVLVGNNVTGSHYVTLQPTNALAADYALTLPLLPASQKFMTLDASGAITAPWAVDGSTITVAANTVGVPNGGIGVAQIASGILVSQHVQDFTSSGSFVVPTGVSSLSAILVGGGGGGQGGLFVSNGTGGGGGGSALPVFGTFAVTAGQTLTITVGAAGAAGVVGGAGQGAGGNGGNSSILNGAVRIALATGGLGAVSGGNAAAFGVLGSQVGSAGQPGGGGATGITGFSSPYALGGAGGSAGAPGRSGGSGGSGGYNVPGGVGGTVGGATPAVTGGGGCGGGGGGGGDTGSSSPANNGAAGGVGLVRLMWVAP